MSKIQELYERIEALRSKMHENIENNSGIIDSKTIKMSQELDSVIIEHYLVSSQEKNSECNIEYKNP